MKKVFAFCVVAALVAACSASQQAQERAAIQTNDKALDAVCAARAVGKDAGL